MEQIGTAYVPLVGYVVQQRNVWRPTLSVGRNSSEAVPMTPWPGQIVQPIEHLSLRAELFEMVGFLIWLVSGRLAGTICGRPYRTEHNAMTNRRASLIVPD